MNLNIQMFNIHSLTNITLGRPYPALLQGPTMAGTGYSFTFTIKYIQMLRLGAHSQFTMYTICT